MKRLKETNDLELMSIFKASIKRNKLNLASLSLIFKLSPYCYVQSNRSQPLSLEKRNNIINAIVYMNNNPYIPPPIKENRITSVEEFIRKVGITKLPRGNAEGVYYSKELDCYL